MYCTALHHDASSNTEHVRRRYRMRGVWCAAGWPRVGFDAVNTALFGFALPSEVTETVSKGLNENISKVNTNGMATDEVTVIDGGLRIKMSGQNVKLSAASQSMQTQ